VLAVQPDRYQTDKKIQKDAYNIPWEISFFFFFFFGCRWGVACELLLFGAVSN